LSTTPGGTANIDNPRLGLLMRGLALTLLALTASAQSLAAESKRTDSFADLDTKCPGFARETTDLESRLKSSHAPPPPMRPALRENLLLMAQQDQEAREFIQISDGRFDLQSPEFRRMIEVDAANLRRLKHIVNQDGFPTARMVGLDGVDAAWLMTLHAGSDPDFQEKVLGLTEGHVRRRHVRSDQVAALTDDLLAGRGKLQRYGTNFEMRDGELKPSPLEDEANVDALRRKAGLGTLANYACFMRAMYNVPERPPATPPPAAQ
jgi:hypothetical protein